MLSDVVKTILQESAGDVAVIGGAVLLYNVIIWKFKQMGGSLSNTDRPEVRTRNKVNRSSGAAPKPQRNAAYYAGYKQALTSGSKTLTASQRYKQMLQGKYNKGSMDYAAGYREGIKQKEWRTYIELVRKEEEQERIEFIRAQIEQKQQELEALREKLENRTYSSAKNETARREILGI